MSTKIYVNVKNVCFVLLVFAFTKGNAIMCYNCTTVLASTLFSFRGECIGASPVECNREENYCYVSTTNLKYDETSSYLTTRGCTAEKPYSESCTPATTENPRTVCTTVCDSDECNFQHDNLNATEKNLLSNEVPGEKLMCFQCANSDDVLLDNCANFLLMECDLGETACTTTISTINGSQVIHRGCSFGGLSGCISIFGEQSCTASCSTDGCNGGNITVSSPTTGKKLKCYNCLDSITTNSTCGYESPTECPSNETHCLTMTTTSDRGTAILRSCSAGVTAGCVELGEEIVACREICSTDGCNGQSKPMPTNKPKQIFGAKPNMLKCYQCKHNTDEEFKECISSGPSDCEIFQATCSTTTTIFDGKPIIIRSCSYGQMSGCEVIAGVESCTENCQTDGCNNGSVGLPVASSIEASSSSMNIKSTTHMVNSAQVTTPISMESNKLKCYNCKDSNLDSLNECNGASPTECSPEYKYCSSVTIKNGVNTTTTKRCSLELSNGCIVTGKTETCTTICDTDGCNNFAKIESSLIALFTTVFVSVWLITT